MTDSASSIPTVSSGATSGGVFSSSDNTTSATSTSGATPGSAFATPIEGNIVVSGTAGQGSVFQNDNANILQQEADNALFITDTNKDLAVQAALDAIAAQEAAETAEANAETSETNAATSASNAATSASNASISESNALTSETNAATSASNASTSASNASTSASNAATSASNASTSESNAATSATNSATSASNAATSESNAATSESNAATSESNAATSASNAATSESNAATSESNAATSASNAATSESNAATSASNASTSASNAATSATAAETAKTNAETAQGLAETAQAAAELARDEAEAAKESIDGLYLGALSSDPTTDGNGNVVTVGDWYFNTTVNQTRIYDGSNWDSIDPTLVTDTTPQLGGNLDLNSSDITGTGNIDITGNISLTGTVDGRDVATDGTKLDGIESGATADQTAAEIKTAYESNLDTNAFTDAEQTKLSGIETNADVTDTANVTAAGALMDSEVTNLAQVKAFDSADYATAAQGALADSALQSGDNVSSLTNDAGYSTTTGTVTSVSATVPTGLIVTGSPITSTGTLAVTYDTGYSIPTTAKQTQWDTAYGWGDHASAGYLTSFTETNDLTAAVTWANVPDANITQSSVTQHQAALSITESQISDLTHYTDTDANTAIDARVTQTFVNNLNVDADTLDGLDSTDFDPAGTAVALAIALG